MRPGKRKRWTLNNSETKKTLRVRSGSQGDGVTQTKQAGDRADTCSLLVVPSPTVKATNFSMLVHGCLAFMRFDNNSSEGGQDTKSKSGVLTSPTLLASFLLC